MERTEIRVRVNPRSSREHLVREADGSYRAWVHAAPTDGAANEAVCRLVAKAADVSPTSVRVVKGFTSRVKVLAIETDRPVSL